MSIEVTTSVHAATTNITHRSDLGTYQLQDLTLDEVKELHAELGKVIEFAEKKPERWGKR
jgi:hypothetical protein